MKPRGMLLSIFVLLAALGCNLPFAGPTEELAPSAIPTGLPTPLPSIAPTLAPTQPLAPSAVPPTALPSPLPSATQPLQATASAPTAPAMVIYNPYAVVLVEGNDVLNARLMPGANNPVVGTLPPEATGLELTGKDAFVGDDRWVGVYLPEDGAGWVNAYYLTEQVTNAEFCADPRLGQVVADFRQAIIDGDGQLLSSLVSPVHGLDVSFLHNGNIANYTPEEAGWIFQSDYAMDWGAHPASGLKVSGTFQETVLPDLFDVLTAQYQTRCNTAELGGGNYTYLWPRRYHNINYLVLHKPGPPGNELSWRTWIAGIEYVEGHLYLFALVHLFWEP